MISLREDKYDMQATVAQEPVRDYGMVSGTRHAEVA